MSEIGRFELPGDGYIENPINSSGDNGSSDTIKIVPDANLLEDSIYNADQYIVIDPTAPNHIHIRAGGAQDASTADLFLGAERTGIQVSDSSGDVIIRSKNPDTTNIYENVNGDGGPIFAIFADLSHISPNANFSVDVDGTLYVIDSAQVLDVEGSPVTELTATPATFVTGMSYMIHESNGENSWNFDSSGVLYGPVMGALGVQAIRSNGQEDLYIYGEDKIILDGTNGEFIGEVDPANQIATIGDISNVVTAEIPFTVNGGTLGNQPTFDGAPLFSGTYVKTGPMLHFQIQVDMDNILTFGTGQYFVELPFHAKYGYQLKNGCLHDDSTGNQFAIGGHVAAGSNQLLLNYIGSNGQDEVFDFNSPVTLTTADNFHISGDYIISDVD
jgi:hypothetical protein